jgi:methylenetetrahydrofolate dehydrogenase (NADP+) / methenyltetrahydrofolate cyclohydrolase
MTATVLDGRKLADILAQDLKEELTDLDLTPELRVILVGDNPQSETYVKSKIRRAEEIGVNLELNKFPSTISEQELIDQIKEFNDDDNVDGIMVQLPLPDHISYFRVIDSIDPNKDVDGFSANNVGKLWLQEPGLIAPATPEGIMTLLRRYDLDVKGKHSVVIGRSNIVGKPLAGLLLACDSTVTLVHRKTQNLKELTKQADFLFVAAGRPGMIDASYVKQGSVVIDVGINHTPDGLKGDIDFDSVKEKASFITPVPGGVGPLTVITLMQQVSRVAKLREKNGSKSS